MPSSTSSRSGGRSPRACAGRSPPLAEECAAVLHAYFEDLAVEAVAKDEGWRRVAALPLLFPDLERGGTPHVTRR
jgi:hypothetical protein